MDFLSVHWVTQASLFSQGLSYLLISLDRFPVLYHMPYLADSSLPFRCLLKGHVFREIKSEPLIDIIFNIVYRIVVCFSYIVPITISNSTSLLDNYMKFLSPPLHAHTVKPPWNLFSLTTVSPASRCQKTEWISEYVLPEEYLVILITVRVNCFEFLLCSGFHKQ
jgi:hypothetical protein